MIDRYSLPRMKAIWDLEEKFKRWLQVEVLACEAWAELGVIPNDALSEIKAKAGFEVQRVLEIEETTRHDVIAFVTAVAEKVGPAGKYIHYGLTSSDVLDTALALQMRDAADIILNDLEALSQVLREKAVEYKDTIMIGRTHGVHAEPTTFGLKLALWWAETQRNKERMQRAREVISVGKISGAVGTYANVEPYVEEYVCRKLGLERAPISTQIIQRDRHAEYMATLGIIASSIDKFATEIRGLQRTEIREVEEPFRSGQKGSSAMPHKRNPVSCEQMSGLARVVRANVQAALENITLWHERDISHSSVERVIIPDSTILVDYMLNTFKSIVQDMHVYPDNMKRNLEKTGGLIFSQKVLLALVEKGMSRDEAYALVQRKAMQAWQEGSNFRELIEGDPIVNQLLGKDEIDALFDPRADLKHVDEVFLRLGLLD